MKLTATVKTKGVSICANINTDGMTLTQDESRAIRDELTDRMMKALVGLPYMDTMLHEVKATR
jgi:hypothetical protein